MPIRIHYLCEDVYHKILVCVSFPNEKDPALICTQYLVTLCPVCNNKIEKNAIITYI